MEGSEGDFPLTNFFKKEFPLTGSKKYLTHVLDSFLYRTLQVEVATACNLDCAICLRKGIERPNRFLSLSNFKCILDPGLFLSPLYGATSPSWFSLYGLLALFALGIWV